MGQPVMAAGAAPVDEFDRAGREDGAPILHPRLQIGASDRPERLRAQRRVRVPKEIGLDL
jgi:hypothetical protein